MMRIFQSMGFGENYLFDFNRRYSNVGSSYQERKSALLYDRHGASHILKPVYEKSPGVFFSVCDDSVLQIRWARERGMATSNLNEILLAQIEENNTEIFYNNHPIGFPSSFVKKLPGCVRYAIAWRAAPIGKADLAAYDMILSNFETLNAEWLRKGWRASIFFPSWDPETLPFSENKNRPTDVFFTGSYARTTGHEERLDLLNAVASLSGTYQVDLHLQYRKWGRLKDRPPGRWIPVPIILPKSFGEIAASPVFGREMYGNLSRAKIVINPATGIAGDVRGNMRCWEAMGCGACMLASQGRYPIGFESGINFEVFTNSSNLLEKIELLLKNESRRESIANAGSKMMQQMWSKDQQWESFKALVA